MERGSDKHGPRLDEEQKQEVEGLERGAPTGPRVEEHRMTEDPGGGGEEPVPGQPVPDAGPVPEEPVPEGGPVPKEPPPEPGSPPEEADAGGPPPL